MWLKELLFLPGKQSKSKNLYYDRQNKFLIWLLIFYIAIIENVPIFKENGQSYFKVKQWNTITIKIFFSDATNANNSSFHFPKFAG